MKPPAVFETNVAVVLDSLAECKVVFDALQDPAVSKDLAGEDLGVRFYSEARSTFTIATPEMPYFITESTWPLYPEFRVRHDDVPFVMSAAQRILDQRRPGERLLNRLTYRTKAAKAIAAALDLDNGNADQ